MKCPKCNNTIDEDSRFCKHCGANLSGESIAMTVSEAAALIGCSTQTILNLCDRGSLVLLGDREHRRTYVSRESVMDFCNIFPDFSKHIKNIQSYEREIVSKSVNCSVDLINVSGVIVDIFMEKALKREERYLLTSALGGKAYIETICANLGISRKEFESQLFFIIWKLQRKCTKYENLAEFYANHLAIVDKLERYKEFLRKNGLALDDDVSTIKNMPLSEIDVPRNAAKRLNAKGILTVGDILNFNEKELLRLMGRGLAYDMILKNLKLYNLHLRQD